MKKRISARRRPEIDVDNRNIRHTENAISMNSVVHTGAKIQLGGLKDGLVSPAYQGARFGKVATWPTTDAVVTDNIANMARPRSRRHAILFAMSAMRCLPLSLAASLTRGLPAPAQGRNNCAHRPISARAFDCTRYPFGPTYRLLQYQEQLVLRATAHRRGPSTLRHNLVSGIQLRDRRHYRSFDPPAKHIDRNRLEEIT